MRVDGPVLTSRLVAFKTSSIGRGAGLGRGACPVGLMPPQCICDVRLAGSPFKFSKGEGAGATTTSKEKVRLVLDL